VKLADAGTPTLRIAPMLTALACVLSLVIVSAASGAPTTPSGERFYERVTPAQKNGATWGQAIVNGNPDLTESSVPLISQQGDRFVDSALQWGGPTGTNANETRFLMVRVPGEGWQARAVDPKADEVVLNGRVFALYGGSADLSFIAIESQIVLDGQDADGNPPFAGANDVYGFRPDDPGLDPENPGSGYELLSCPPLPAAPCSEGTSVAKAAARSINPVSADGSTTVFETSEILAPAADGGPQVYARVGNQVRHISQPLPVVPPGATQVGFEPSFLSGDSSAPDGGPNIAGAVSMWPNPISSDGSRVFFAAPATGPDTRIYVRIADERTLELSRVRGGSEAPQKVKFRGASVSGDRALITTQQALLPVAGEGSAANDPNSVEDLYLWTYDEQGDPGNDSLAALTRLSGLPQVGDGPAVDGQTGLSIAGMSDDLTRVYFTTRDGAVGGSPADVNLYMAELPDGDPRSGRVRFIATTLTDLLLEDPATWSSVGGCLNGQNVGEVDLQLRPTCGAASPDGRYLAFQSRVPLTVDDRDADGADACASPVSGLIPSYCREDVFVYDSVEGALRLASGGVAPVSGNGQHDARFEVIRDSVSVADDGRVIFSTAEGLVAGDANGMLDVYEFQDGDLDLISSGKGPNNSLFAGASEGAKNVFFLTVDDLRDDTDGSSDFYNARLGDTFPDTQWDCSLDQDRCQVPGKPDSGTGPTATAGSGDGNFAAPLRVRLSRATVSAAARRRAARTGMLTVRAVVPSAGRLTVTAKARVRAKRRVMTVARRTVRARAAGAIRVRLPLSRAARRQLAAGRRLRLSVGLTMPGARPARALTLALEKRGRR
jgi:hypothetical protein